MVDEPELLIKVLIRNCEINLKLPFDFERDTARVDGVISELRGNLVMVLEVQPDGQQGVQLVDPLYLLGRSQGRGFDITEL